MKRIIIVLLGLTTLSSGILLPLAQTSAAYPSQYTFDGYVEQVGNGVVKGWVYQRDQAVSLSFRFRNVNTKEILQYEITNTQVSNKIAYWTQRTDVQEALNAKYRTTLPYTRPQGFMLTSSYMPAGEWQLQSVYTIGLVSSELLILPKNPVLVTSTSRVYEEGYIDTTDGSVKGWAYSSAATSSDIAPKITMSFRKTDTNEIKVLTLNKGVMQEGIMQRTERQDVVSFLTMQRGSVYANFFSPNTNRTYMGFTFNLNGTSLEYPDKVLSKGTWYIESIMADDFPVQFGNTNPSRYVNIQ